jgi:hypothetical protein
MAENITPPNYKFLWKQEKFKDFLAKGSNISELVNDTGYLTIATFPTGNYVTTSSFNAFTSSYNTGSFTGSFIGDGSGLTNLPIGATGSNGEIQFNSGGSFGADSGLVWDNTNKRLGVGTNTPSASLHLFASTTPFGPDTSGNNPFRGLRVGWTPGTVTLDMGIQPNTSPVCSWIQSRTANNYANNQLLALQPNGGNLTIGALTNGGFRLDVAGSARIQGNTTITTNAGRLILNQSIAGSVFNGIDFITYLGSTIGSLIMNQSTGEFRLFTGNTYFPTFYSSGAEAMRIFTTRNILIQNGGTFTDAGFRLDVNGTTRLNGNTSIGGSTAGARLDIRAQGALSTDSVLRVRNSADTLDILEVRGDNRTFVRNSFNVESASGTTILNIINGANNASVQLFGGQLDIIAPTRQVFTNNSSEKFRVDNTYSRFQNNVSIGSGDTFGTNATNTLKLDNGVAPSTSPSDVFQLYSADIVAGNAAPHFRTENGSIIKLYKEIQPALSGSANTGDAATDALIEAMKTIILNLGFGASS